LPLFICDEHPFDSWLILITAHAPL
jgi:hypothetical protein